MVDNAAERYRLAGWWTGCPLVERFESHVATGPDELALVGSGNALTRSEVWRAAGEAADEIRTAVGTCRRVVLIHLPNCPDWVVMFLAVLRAGHVPATPPVTTTEAHLRHICGLIQPAMVISAGPDRQAAPHEAIRRAVVGVATQLAVAVVGEAQLVVHGPAVSPTSAVDVPDNTAHLMFTSSTTGPPKAVSHSEDTLAALNLQFAERFGLDHSTPVFMPSPLGHSVGAIHGARLSLLLGAPLILQDEWDANAALDLVARHRADFTAAATPFLLDLVNAEWRGCEPKLAPMRSFLCGGAQVPPALIRRCAAELPNTYVTPLWGMTEGGLTTCVADSSQSQVEETVGVGLPGLELRVLDAEGGPACQRRGRAGDARARRVQRLLRSGRAVRGAPHRRWVLPHRRPRPHRCRRLCVDHRAPQRPDHPRGREHLARRDRERNRRPWRRGGSRRDRVAPTNVLASASARSSRRAFRSTSTRSSRSAQIRACRGGTGQNG